jgi:hypothetical protein
MTKKSKIKRSGLIQSKNRFLVFRLVVVGGLVGLFALFGFLDKNTLAQTWSEPTNNPPLGQVTGPVWAQSSTAQTGSLYVNGQGRFDTSGITDTYCTNAKVCGATVWTSAGTGSALAGDSYAGYGVYAVSDTGIGLYAQTSNTSTYAGQFAGNVYVGGGGLGIGAAPSVTYPLNVSGQVNATGYCLSSGNCIAAWPGGITGGTANYVTKYTSATAIAPSEIYDSGTAVGIGTASPGSQLEVTSDATVATRGITIGQHSTDIAGAVLTEQKSRGSHASPAIVASGDYVSANFFAPYVTTSGYMYTAGWGARINGTVTATSAPTDLWFATSGGTNDGDPYSSGHVRMVISSGGSVGVANTSPSALLTLGTAGTTAGTLSLAGATSGVVTVQAQGVAGTWILTLPSSAGTSGQYLETNGSGQTSWMTVSGGGTVTNSGSAANYVAKFSTATNITDSLIYDTGTAVGIGTTTPNGMLDVETSGTTSIYGNSTNSSGYGVYGNDNNGGDGVYGNGTIGTYGAGSTTGAYGGGSTYGIEGSASATGGVTYGAYGKAASSTGYGVYGTNTATTGTPIAVYGTSSGTVGVGVEGSGYIGVEGTSAAAFGPGIYGASSVASGYGLWGNNTTVNGTAIGVYGSTSSTAGVGIYGQNTVVSNSGDGVYGVNTSVSGYGVYGNNTSVDGVGVYGTGNLYGIEGDSSGGSNSVTGVLGIGGQEGVLGKTTWSAGYGVFGQNPATSGMGTGVYGTSASPDGYGVYGSNTGGGDAIYSNGPLYSTGNITGGPGTTISAPSISASGNLFVGGSILGSANLIMSSGASNFVEIAGGTGGAYIGGSAAASSGTLVLCIVSATNRLYLGASATSCTPSSERYKHDIEPLPDSLGIDAVNELNPVSYVFNGTNIPAMGFIAEQAAKVDERLVVRKDGEINAIDWSQFVPILTKAIQQQQQEIIGLKQQLAQLEAK